MQELTVSATALQIFSNFDAVRAELQENLKVYEIEVTEENVPEAKKMAAELSDLGKQLNRVKIDKAKEFSAPIEEFKSKAGELLELCAASREKILAQVKVFEDKRRKLCHDLMTSYMVNNYGANKVRPEYQTGLSQIAGIVGLSMVAKDKLSKAGRDAVEKIVQADKIKQERHDGRLARVEAACHIAGVSPLTKAHVSAYLDLEDADFESKCNDLIRAEGARMNAQREKIQKEEEAKARAKMEAEAKAKKEADDRALAEKLAEQQKAAMAELKEIQKNAEAAAQTTTHEIQEDSGQGSTQTLPKAETPAPVEKNQQEAPEDKKTLVFKYTVTIHVAAKAAADAKKVFAYFVPVLAAAAKSMDARVIDSKVE